MGNFYREISTGLQRGELLGNAKIDGNPNSIKGLLSSLAQSYISQGEDSALTEVLTDVSNNIGKESELFHKNTLESIFRVAGKFGDVSHLPLVQKAREQLLLSGYEEKARIALVEEVERLKNGHQRLLQKTLDEEEQEELELTALVIGKKEKRLEKFESDLLEAIDHAILLMIDRPTPPRTAPKEILNRNDSPAYSVGKSETNRQIEESSNSPSWLYWVLGLVIVGGMAKLILGSRR